MLRRLSQIWHSYKTLFSRIYIYIYTYGIHHRRIFWSSYRKLAWVGFEPTTTAFRSDALTDWDIRPWVQLALRANFVQLLPFHRFFSVTFHFGYCLRQSPCSFSSSFCIYIYIYTYIPVLVISFVLLLAQSKCPLSH